jgi:hypothetical protein
MLSWGGERDQEPEMDQRPESRWFARFHDDLAWDIFTLDCILATVSAMTVAVLASLSGTFAEQLVVFERWVWAVFAVPATVAVACPLRIVASDRHGTAELKEEPGPQESRDTGDAA